MRSGIAWNVLRVLVILGLGYVLFVNNTVGMVTYRRELFDLITHQAEMTPDAVQENLGRVDETYARLLKFNFYGLPALVVLALLPYACRNKGKTVVAQRYESV